MSVAGEGLGVVARLDVGCVLDKAEDRDAQESYASHEDADGRMHGQALYALGS
jgi:hypothetical protein